MKKIFAFFCLLAAVFANDEIDIVSDIYSKTNTLKQVKLRLLAVGENLSHERLLDTVNMIISSYFYEDLFTEAGKQNFKNTLIKYASFKHSMEIDEVLILELKSLFSSEKIDELIKELKNYKK